MQDPAGRIDLKCLLELTFGKIFKSDVVIETREVVMANVRIELLCGTDFSYRGGCPITRRIAEQNKCTRQMSLRKLRVDGVSPTDLVLGEGDPFFLFFRNDEHSVKGIRMSQPRVRQCKVRISRERFPEKPDSGLVLILCGWSILALIEVVDTAGVVVVASGFESSVGEPGLLTGGSVQLQP